MDNILNAKRIESTYEVPPLNERNSGVITKNKQYSEKVGDIKSYEVSTFLPALNRKIDKESGSFVISPRQNNSTKNIDDLIRTSSFN